LWTGRRGLSAGDGSVAPGLLRTPPPATRGAAGCNVRFVSIMGGGRAARGARASPSDLIHVTERVPRRRGFAGGMGKSCVLLSFCNSFPKVTFLFLFSPGCPAGIVLSVGRRGRYPAPADWLFQCYQSENPICL